MAKKKYYQSRKDRRDEREGMDRRLDEGSRRFRIEGREEMNLEDRSAPSNCPREVMYREFPSIQGLRQEMDSSYHAQDDWMDEAMRKASKQNLSKKY